MSYTLIIYDERQWQKDTSALTAKQLQKIAKRILELEKEPWPDNVQVKQLQHYTIADFRLRVGDYRILFNKNNEKKEIYLLRVLHRSKLY